MDAGPPRWCRWCRYVAAEVLNAWSALDVFVVAIMAGVLEIQQFAAFIVGDKCDAINGLIEQYFDKALGGDDKCFDVTATLDHGCWILFCAVLIAMFAGQMVTAAAYNAVDQRRRIAHGDGGMPTKAKKSACLQALRRFCSCAFRIEREA